MGAAQSTRNAVIKHVAPAVNTTKPYDATLAQNLKNIGQVNVQSPASIQRSLQITHHSVNGRTIDSFGLSQLLDARKDASIPTANALLDDGLVRRLARRYNTPSIGRENTIELSDGDRRLYREAIWVDAGQAAQPGVDSKM